MNRSMLFPALQYGYDGASGWTQSSSAEIRPETIGLIIVALIALLIALAVVNSMKAKLKTARHQGNAANYMRSNSLTLQVRQDHYLYTTEQRRRIPQNQNANRGPMQKGR